MNHSSLIGYQVSKGCHGDKDLGRGSPCHTNSVMRWVVVTPHQPRGGRVIKPQQVSPLGGDDSSRSLVRKQASRAGAAPSSENTAHSPPCSCHSLTIGQKDIETPPRVPPPFLLPPLDPSCPSHKPMEGKKSRVTGKIQRKITGQL